MTAATFTRADLIRAREELVRSRGEVARLKHELDAARREIAGLRASRTTTATAPCPHCGQAYAAGTGLAQHVRSCAKRADKLARRDEELASAKARATAAEKRCQDLLKQLEAKGPGAPDELVAKATRAEQRARKAERFAAATVFRAETAEAEVNRLAELVDRREAEIAALREGIRVLQQANKTLAHVEHSTEA